MNATSTWPEQDAIESWCMKHGIKVPHLVRMELKDAVTKIRHEQVRLATSTPPEAAGTREGVLPIHHESDHVAGEIAADIWRRNDRHAAVRRLMQFAHEYGRKDRELITKLDGLIEEVGGCTFSCINVYEDLKAALIGLKKRAEQVTPRPAPAPDGELREKLACLLCEQHGEAYAGKPYELEPGDAYGIDGHNAKGEPCHFNWRRFAERADEIMALLHHAPASGEDDARRYRWLRDMIFDDRIIVAPDRMLHGTALDDAIDAARSPQAQGEEK